MMDSRLVARVDFAAAQSESPGAFTTCVCFADGQLLAFTRGQRSDFFVMLNFGGWAGHHNLGYLNLPDGNYCELWNSTWPAFVIRSEDEEEHTNGGRGARLNRPHWLHIPGYGALVLERVD